MKNKRSNSSFFGNKSKTRKFANINIESKVLKTKKLVDKIITVSDFNGSIDVIAIDGKLDFSNDIIDWFKKKALQKGKHTPFIGDKNKIKDMLKQPLAKDVGLFMGIYDRQTDKITDMVVVVVDELDVKTQEVLGNEPLVILS